MFIIFLFTCSFLSVLVIFTLIIPSSNLDFLQNESTDFEGTAGTRTGTESSVVIIQNQLTLSFPKF